MVVLGLVLTSCEASSTRYLAILPQCWEISGELDQDWEDAQQRNEVASECYRAEDEFRVTMGVEWYKNENAADSDFEYLKSLADGAGLTLYDASSVSIWSPKFYSYSVTNHATFLGRNVEDSDSMTCVGYVSHYVTAQSGKLRFYVEGQEPAVWKTPCLADDLIEGDARPELINRVMDMIILRLEHMD